MKCAVILLCAGRGKRLKSNIDKAFIKLNSLPLFIHSYKVFKDISDFSQIVIVARKKFFPLIKYHVKDKRVILQEGGRLRRDSVYKGLKCLNDNVKYVFIHDSARPFINRPLINRLLKAVKSAKAVIPATAISEAVKEVKKAVAVKTLARERLYTIQTPQAFDKDLIMTAYEKNTKTITYDDAQLVELMGGKVKVIKGLKGNIKITHPDDLILAEGIINGKKVKRSKNKTYIF